MVRWTEDELGAEPPPLFPRAREASDTSGQVEPDVSEATASAATPAVVS